MVAYLYSLLKLQFGFLLAMIPENTGGAGEFSSALGEARAGPPIA